MQKKAIFITFGILITSCLFILVLFYRAGANIKYSQDFTRVFPKGSFVNEKARLKLDDNSYYLAGADQNNVYLGNDKSKLKIFITNSALEDLQQMSIKPENPDTAKLERTKIQIDSPFFFLNDGKAPVIYKGSISDWKCEKFMQEEINFTQVVSISNNKLAIQLTASERGKNNPMKMLALIQVDSPYTQLNPDILKKQIDEYYSPSGTLRYSKKLNALVYTYHFRNLFQVIDTNLNTVSEGHTIDTITKVKIRPIQISATTRTLASPPAIVNRNAQVCEDLLFVHSNLMGNETRADFDKASVIDVYDLNTKLYKMSFYISDYGEEKLEHFIVLGNTLIGKFRTSIGSYNIDCVYQQH